MPRELRVGVQKAWWGSGVLGSRTNPPRPPLTVPGRASGGSVSLHGSPQPQEAERNITHRAIVTLVVDDVPCCGQYSARTASQQGSEGRIRNGGRGFVSITANANSANSVWMSEGHPQEGTVLSALCCKELDKNTPFFREQVERQGQPDHMLQQNIPHNKEKQTTGTQRGRVSRKLHRLKKVSLKGLFHPIRSHFCNIL